MVESHLHGEPPIPSNHTPWGGNGASIHLELGLREPAPSLRLQPELRINRQSAHLATLRIEEAAVVRELSVAKETRQHRQRARRQSLVYEWFLPVQRSEEHTSELQSLRHLVC